MLFELLKQKFATSTFLYVGYSMQDPNWRTLQSEMRAEFAPARPPRSYRVAPTTDPLDIEILRAKMDIETIDGDLSDLSRAVSLLANTGDADRLKQLEAMVPGDLLPAFHRNPAATARLLSSWEYVNSSPFAAPFDMGAYLAGDLPTWSLIGAGRPFERDVEPPLYDELLDFATSEDDRVSSILVLGSAGYGVTTVLMKAAARLVQERAGPVLMHRRGTPLVEGDVEFAADVLGQRPFFVVDNAADVGAEVVSAVRRLRDLQKPACFLLGERINEWRQRRLRISPAELEIGPLSDVEIERLLSYLEDNGALNQLEPLDASLRFAAVKEKHEQQLLVVMREVTEGRGFDAIIEDEYRAISDERAQATYAAACALYRLRIPTRMDVLAEVLGVNLVDVYDSLGPDVQGVVRVDTIDEAKGIYAARARHQKIAEIVWERALATGERDRLLERTLGALNLSFVLDKKAFEALVRDDRGIDSIGSFENKVNFFQRAARKDPEDPYVLQHYARMLLRERKPDLALSIIDQAIEIRASIRVLKHTRGMILSQMALHTDSEEIARRRLVQSEAAFQESFGPQRRDAYTYQSLAELYLGWAQRSSSDEAAEYVTKAEDTIAAGLRVVDDREGLYFVSARIEEFLGNQPEAVHALERAVEESPTSTVARYLLARAYFRSDRWDEVVALLKPVLEQDPQEVRSAVLYAKALERSGRPYDEPVAILRLADLYGRRDARYVATLGGMLTMDGEFTAAEGVFSGSRTVLSYRESNRIEYRPRPGNGPTPMLEGTVINVRAGYAFIQSPGYPDFFWPGAWFGSTLVRRGIRIRFKPAFTARGGVAVDATEVAT